jgi:hypothetical protein
MMKKIGVNTTRAEKHGPVVKSGHNKPTEKTVRCACGKKFLKSCPNEAYCDIAVFTCPYCGREIN